MARQEIAKVFRLTEPVTGAICESIKSQLVESAERIADMLGLSEKKTINVAMHATIDASGSSTTIDTGIRFGLNVTDKRTITFDDPNQLTFSILTQEQARERKATQDEFSDSDDDGGMVDTEDEPHVTAGEPSEEPAPKAKRGKKAKKEKAPKDPNVPY